MIDVANEARVSQTTVSLVLNHADGARLSAETRQRVMKAAAGSAISRCAAARAAAVGAPSIGFLCDELSTDPWTAIALDGVREKAWERGLTVIVMATRGDADMEAAALAQLAGAAAARADLRHHQHAAGRRARAAGAICRSVLLNCHVANGALPSVVPGEVGGGHAATDFLIARRPPAHRLHQRRGRAWRRRAIVCAAIGRRSPTADLPFDPDLVRDGNWQPLSGYEATRELMRLASPPTAIFCANDLMAVGCYEALRELGLQHPRRRRGDGLRRPRNRAAPASAAVDGAAAAFRDGRRSRRNGCSTSPTAPTTRPRQIKVECPIVKRKLGLRPEGRQGGRR